jgi:radical SAM protein with 4Fe4S-binding SPASM domain
MPTLEITTIIGCLNRCDYCPQDVLLKVYEGKKTMAFEDFKRILNNVPSNVQIDFTGFSEPFFNSESSQMMRYSLEQGYRTVLYTTLGGFTQEDANVLRGLHFNDLVFHIHKGIDLDKFKEKRTLFESIVHPVNRIAILDNDYGHVNTPVWSRAGNVFGTMPQKGKFRCAFAGKLFDHNVVLPNGDVYICCMDYGLNHKIGNLFETKYDDLNRQSIVDLSESEGDYCICRRCEICQIL